MKQVDKLVLLTLALLGWIGPIQAQHFAWGQLLTGNGTTVSSTVDDAGNSYLFGTFRGQLTLGATTVTATNPAYTDLFIAKYDAAGNLRWLTQAGSNANDAASAIATDGRGNVYVTGSHGTGFYFGANYLTSGGHFLARIDTANGGTTWLRRLEGTTTSGSIALTALAADPAGNCYMVGSISAINSFGQRPLLNPGTRPNAVVAKADPSGNVQWVAQVLEDAGAPTSSLLRSTTIGVNPGGELAIGGSFRGRFTVGALPNQTTLASSDTVISNRDAFVIRLAPNGALRWARTSIGEDNQVINGVALDDLGNTYVAGGGSGAFSFSMGAPPVQGVFVARFNATGQADWLRGQAVATPDHFTRDDAALALVADGQGNTCISGVFKGTALVLGTNVLPHNGYSPVGYVGALFLAGYDAAGRVRWAKTDTDPATAQGYFSAGNVSMDRLGRLYVLGAGYGSRTYDHIVLNAAGSGGRSFLLRLDQLYQRVSGVVYLDQNANGSRDPGEPPFPQPIVLTDSVQDGVGTSFPSDGHYNLWLQPGQYEVNLVSPPAHYYLIEGARGYRGVLNGYTNDSTHHFGLAPVPGQPDVRINLMAYTPARPGFITRYRTTLENVGTTAATPDTIGMQLDSHAAFIASEPASQQFGTDPTHYWVAPVLAPFERRDFDVQFSLPINMALGTRLQSTSLVRMPADAMPADNVDTLAQEVTGSYDPNSIEVNYPRLTLPQLLAGQSLEYTIRFQNLGTDTAFTVMISDTLDRHKINLSRVSYVGSSHSCLWWIDANAVLHVWFKNIRLPHRGANVLRSQGFVVFRMVPQRYLSDGSLIPNAAHITFDYNAPIRTNTALTLIGTLANGLPAEAAEPIWSLYPNPAEHRVTVTALLPTTGTVRVQVVDLLGREVSRTTAEVRGGAFRQELDLADLAPGVYLVRLTAPDGTTATRRLVRR